MGLFTNRTRHGERAYHQKKLEMEKAEVDDLVLTIYCQEKVWDENYAEIQSIPEPVFQLFPGSRRDCLKVESNGILRRMKRNKKKAVRLLIRINQRYELLADEGAAPTLRKHHTEHDVEIAEAELDILITQMAKEIEERERRNDELKAEKAELVEKVAQYRVDRNTSASP